MSPLSREWEPSWRCSIALNLSGLRRGSGDPTYRIVEDGHWIGMRTPIGPATLHLTKTEDHVVGRAWGEGAPWALETMPALLGAEDDPSGFVPQHRVLESAWRRFGHWRVAKTQRVWEALAPAIIEQKVTGQEAYRGFRNLVIRHGERAPGPLVNLWIQPSAETVRSIPSWAWLQMHIDPPRSKALVTAARYAQKLEARQHDTVLVDETLRALPGLGVWTSAEVRQRALGDADAVSFGDYHVAPNIGWALTGTPIDDAALEELLEPWRPHRYRVQALVALAGLNRPRRGPRMAPRTHLPAR